MMAAIKIKNLICIMSFLVLAMSFYYALEINNIIRGGYLMRDYDVKLDNILSENNALQINLAKIGFLKNFEEKIGAMDFKRIENIKYINMPALKETPVAKLK